MGLSAARRSCSPAALAPTDPVLAGDIGVGPPGEEGRSTSRTSASAPRPGFNDGLAFPFVLLGIALAADDDLAGWVAADVVYGIAAGIAVVGAAIGLRHRRPRSCACATASC